MCPEAGDASGRQDAEVYNDREKSVERCRRGPSLQTGTGSIELQRPSSRLKFSTDRPLNATINNRASEQRRQHTCGPTSNIPIIPNSHSAHLYGAALSLSTHNALDTLVRGRTSTFCSDA